MVHVSIGVAASMLGVAVSTLRRWHREGRFEPAFRTTGGHRRYAVSTVQSFIVRVSGDRDPGYGATARMLGQAAACLAQDIPQSMRGGGFWTPATVFGNYLLERLQRHAGVKAEILTD